MKKILSFGILIILFSHTQAQSVGLGTASPDSSAILDVNSKIQGFLPPRMYFQQRDKIGNPSAGLIIWCIDCGELQVFDGTIWKNFNGNAAKVPDTAFVAISTPQAQQVGIGTFTANASAELDLVSTTKGFLPPRMTKIDRDAIQNPVAGLMIWCIDCDELQVYDGDKWKNGAGATASVTSFSNVQICNQVWMIKNLDITSYRNGELIPHVTDPSVWSNLTTGAWCWYNNDSAANAGTYGRLYNWYAVSDPRGLAPVGWHIPSYTEWSTLMNCIGGADIAGGKMKSTSVWNAPNAGATNSSGFTAIPGGFCYIDGSFGEIGIGSYWWSSTDAGLSNATGLDISNTTEYLNTYDYLKKDGFSIRCVRD